MSKKVKKKITTNSRVINELLTKYRNTFYALKELINNSIQAKSTEILIDLDYSTKKDIDSYIKSVSIRDNGHGVSISDFENKILEIGTTAKTGGQGVGRFGSLQLGRVITIETVSFDRTLNKFTKVQFTFDVDALKSDSFHNIDFVAEEEELDGQQSTYYQVAITNLYTNSQSDILRKNKLSIEFKKENFRHSLFQHYPIEIFNDKIAFVVNRKKLEKKEFLVSDPKHISRKYIATTGVEYTIKLFFYNVTLNDNNVKVFLQTENAGIKTVSQEFIYSSDYHTPDLGTWFIYLDSPMFTTDLFRNIDLENLGYEEWKNLKEFIKDVVNEFFKENNSKFEKFISKLREDKSSKEILEGINSSTHFNIFNKVAYLLENDYHLLEKEDKTRFVIYPLVNTAIKDGRIRQIIQDTINLKPETKEKFYGLLERTDLENVVHFSSSVAEKLEFLNFLHDITYGKISDVLKERSQLHKIIESQLWLFGEYYGETPTLWSDRKIGNILIEIRNKHMAYKPTQEDENLIDVRGSDDITDLFFFNEKVLDNNSKEIMIVELKAPNCAIAQKELGQIDKYAFTIEQHSALGSENIKYKLILISSKLAGFAKSKLDSAREKYGNSFTYDIKSKTKNIEVLVMTWSELIEINKRKLKYMSKMLTVKDKDVNSKFESEYAHLIDDKIRSQLKKVG